MSSTPPPASNILIRSFQRRDLEDVEQLCGEKNVSGFSGTALDSVQKWQTINRWYGVLKFLSMFPNPLQNLFSAYVATQNDRIRGVIQVSPFNRTRSTWRIDQVLVGATAVEDGDRTLPMDIGSMLLRHCFQTIWEARTWMLEVNVNDSNALALYRHNGFQPLAHMTYWAIAPDLLQSLSEREPDLPNLLPVNNADAFLLHQLDTVSMPPLVRQVFDRNVFDFKTGLSNAAIDSVRHWANRSSAVSGYVFEPQRKAAIGYFNLELCQDGSHPHTAQLTVHPAYTWLYPELLAQMARVARDYPPQSLRLASSDYQPEREEYLERIGAERTEHTLLMSRSVWHKLRETKPVSLEGLQLSDVLQGLQPARKPVPGRFSLLESIRQLPQLSGQVDWSYLNVDDRMATPQPPLPVPPPEESAPDSSPEQPERDRP
ncbi:MAG TPA: GNAT family N-acetyltransferase [Chroococcidiopsis sp.]